MQSCDTFALSGSRFALGRNLLAKNSDRPLGEAQPLTYAPAQQYPEGAMLQCTHLTIPQVKQTYAVLGCRPDWIWGFEMGVNQFGLAIGNEAQGSRCAAETEEGLLGMDLLRLALERAKNAREAISVITDLLEQYGQNANASQLFDRRYENSFLLTDPEEIWLLETAGRQWAAKQIKDWAAISNCYSIGTEFDLASADAETCARENRWLAPSEAFDFAKAYTMPAVRQTSSVPRWRRLRKRIEAAGVPVEQTAVKSILRDHFEGELIEPRNGGCYGGFVTICMHAMTWDAAQTTASLLVYFDEKLGPVCRYAPSMPCCSVYLPVYFTGQLPECMTRGGAVYDPKSLWWTVERLAMAISIDEPRFGPKVRGDLQRLEQVLEQRARQAEQQADPAVRSALTEEAAQLLMEKAQRHTEQILQTVRTEGGLYGIRKEFLQEYCSRVQIPLE